VGCPVIGEMGTVLSSELKAGNYCAVRTRGLFGYIIRAATSSPVDHAFVCLGNGLIAEATVYGCRVDSLEQYRGQAMFTDAGDKINAAQRSQICKAARGFAGREYSWTDILLIGLRRIGLRSRWLVRHLRDRDALICSELVALAGAAGSQDWLCGTGDAALVTPALLALRPGVERVMWS
jgi:hypothetical protein